MFGVWGAALPLIRRDLRLSYQDVGVLLSVPTFISAAVEPTFGILADSGRRRLLIISGGFAFAAGLLAVASATGFPVLLAAFILIWPASGAFVSLSQATLMDMEPDLRERNMARWVLAGSVGVVTGPVLVAAVAGIGISWRMPVVALAVLGGALAIGTLRGPHLTRPTSDGLNAWRILREAVRQLRNREVVRWLTVLQLSDLMLDVLLAYVALYFVDVVGFTPAAAGLAVLVSTVAGLIGEAAMLGILRRVPGLRYLRISAVLAAAVFVAFLLAPWPAAKLGAVAMLSIVTAGWYTVPNARLYDALPGRSGTAVALTSASDLVGALLPLSVALVAGRAGLGLALWICLLAPVALLILVPRHEARLTGPATGHTVS
ncbi:MAG TPA: MFS transporter [Actinomycetota bacterium]|nr:MFS transporter [Actinomycetota bacterium]